MEVTETMTLYRIDGRKEYMWLENNISFLFLFAIIRHCFIWVQGKHSIYISVLLFNLICG